MPTLNFHPAGRHFLQIPGPSPVPDRILRAMSHPTIDHRGPEFGALGLQVLAGAVLCGYARDLAVRCALPVFDGVTCAVGLARAQLALRQPSR